MTRTNGLLLVNPRSGDRDVQRELAARAADAGVEVRVLADGDDPAALAESADAPALGVAGGDGSLAAVAAVAARRDLPFVCVPAGTRNHFARDLGLDPDDPQAALDAFAGGGERRVDLAFAGDRPFLNNVSLGVYATLVHRRERHRRRRDSFARLRALATVATHRPVPLRLDGERVDAQVLLLASNAYDLGVLSLGERPRLDEGLLYAYVVGGLPPAARDERTGTRFTVDSPRDRVRAAVDGEPATLATPIELRVEPRALRVLVSA